MFHNHLLLKDQELHHQTLHLLRPHTHNCVPQRRMQFSLIILLVLVALSVVEGFIVATGVTTKRAFALRATQQDVTEDATERIASATVFLTRAAETKAENSDLVVEALLDLERLTRQQVKENPQLAQQTLEALAGNGGRSWRLIFTTGTVSTQEKRGRVNYFPIKAIQSFNSDTNPWRIENGIYIGDFPLLKFQGDFDWTVQKSGVTKLTFDFTRVTLIGFLELQLKRGEAANIGASTGLGSESNVNLDKQGKRAFFNWISANDQIATARGGGGGLALWKLMD
jgi:hypothetical protein